MTNTNDTTTLTLSYDDVPAGWALCFNQQCKRADSCLRLKAGRLAPGALTWHTVVTPRMGTAAHCHYYAAEETVSVAWGFSHLYDRVLKSHYTYMRKTLTNYLHGKTYYYKYRNGRLPLMPDQQAWISSFVRQMGYDADALFDRYGRQYRFPTPPAGGDGQAAPTA